MRYCGRTAFLSDILIFLYRLKDAKNDMTLQAEECSRLKRVNSELDSQIEQLAQDHQYDI